MPLNKEGKKIIVDEILAELKKSSGVILTDYQGLSVQGINQIRKNLKEKGIKYKVFKNTLIERAAKEVGLEELITDLSGCTAIAFSETEPILTLKMLNQYALENKEIFKLKKAFIEGQVFFGDQLGRIANLPTKKELIATLLGNMKSPISSFVYTLSAPLTGLVNVIDQIRKQREESSL